MPSCPTAVGGEFTLGAGEQTEVPVLTNDHDSGKLLIWFPSEHGLPESFTDVSRQLAALNTTVWQLDLFSAWFLPIQSSSLEELDAQALASLLNQAQQRPFEEIYLAASGRGAIPLLRALNAWQHRFGPDNKVRGVLLLHPNLYYETPRPGEEARYLPIASASNYPTYIIQPASSPWRWQLAELQSKMAAAGAIVYTQILPNIRDRFFFRPDATEEEKLLTRHLGRYLHNGMTLLARHPPPEQGVAVLADPLRPTGKQEALLRAVTPRQPPSRLDLANLRGKKISLDQLQGQVVLVNFWASWCPPCVHEMPSMERLQQSLQGKPFTILAVNMAEDAQTIRQFLATRVKVSFPIVRDHDGAELKKWKVFAFPTSYLIDKKGIIRYALFGALDWQRPDVVNIVRTLLDE